MLLAKRPEFDRGDYEAAIKGALEDEDSILLDSFRKHDTNPAVSGSTVALGFVNLSTGDLVVANLGDSHVILAEREPMTDRAFNIVSLDFSWRVRQRMIIPTALATPHTVT